MRTLAKSILISVIFFATINVMAKGVNDNDFVSVVNGKLMLNGKPYKYVGTNMWYAAILASEGRGGNRAKLCSELDRLHSLGVDNLRILVGADGGEGLDSHVTRKSVNTTK